MGEMLLEWNNHNKAMSNKLWEYFKEEYLVDFSVTCHGQQKKVHKFVLALLFPMLKESLRSNDTFYLGQEESTQDETVRISLLPTPQCLNLDNIADHAEDMDYLIQFAYTGKTIVPNEHADCLMHIADTMEINSLKESLSQNGKRKLVQKIEPNDMTTPLSRLRPRTQLKKVEKLTYDDDDDVDFHSIVDDEYSSDGVKRFDDCSDDTDEETNRRPKKKKNHHQNKITPKGPDDCIKEKSSVQRENTTKTLQNGTKTDSDKEPNGGVQLQETSTNVETKEKKNLKCDHCHFVAVCQSKLLRHLKTHTRLKERTTGDNIKENKHLKCDQCDFVAKWPSKLQRHLKTHLKPDRGIKREKVPKVSKQLDCEEQPDDDIKEKALKCLQCDYVAKHRHQLNGHMSRHTPKPTKVPNQFACDVCKKVFGTKRWLEKHRATKSCTEYFVCKYCGHKTRQKTTLQQHIIASHQLDVEGNPLEKNLKCPDCGFVCYADYQLRAHKRAKHERFGKFKCKECNFAAPYIGQLLRHERQKHQDVKSYMCEECGHQFKFSSNFHRHVLLRHKGGKPHKCNICNAEYSDPRSFKIHMQRHNGIMGYRFVCHICGHNLRRKYELRNHMKKKHGMELEETRTDLFQSQETCEPVST